MIAEFKPFIYYDENLAAVRVHTADTTHVEIPLTNLHYIDVFERAHHNRYGQEHFVGFNLWVAKDVCARMGIKPLGTLSMRGMLRFLYEREEDESVQNVITNIMLPMLEAHNLDEFEIST